MFATSTNITSLISLLKTQTRPKGPRSPAAYYVDSVVTVWRPRPCYLPDVSEEIPRLCCLAAWGLFLVLAVAGTLALGAEYMFDGVYYGKRVLTKGSGPTCPTEEDVSVTIHGETLTFTNSALEKFIMPFYPGSDGSFGQTHTGEGRAVVHCHGRIIGDVLDADVTNPPCRYHWHLTKG